MAELKSVREIEIAFIKENFEGIKIRVGNLAFLRPNNSILAFLFLVWP